jgi:GNAT superfamily N-acetyltransferase
MDTAIDIRPAAFPRDLACVTGLFRDYAQSLDTDLCFQGFERELATLPGKYAPPSGRLLLAWDGAEAVGCVALRQVEEGRAEIKRLYVRPGMRGRQLGYQLATRICAEARTAGYAHICLDTLPSMSTAIQLYTSIGFTPTAPYVFNPVPGTLFLSMAL